MIHAFGTFVVGGNLVVGIVVFLILVIIQFVVITSGAGRVAEVAARFTLDAMPGKQMAIDADLNAGQITDAEARVRREKIQQEADFYGAMDGASKFVRGDAVAGLIIVAVNLFAGIVIGMLQQGLGFTDALHTFSTAHRRRRHRGADPGAPDLDGDRPDRDPRRPAASRSASRSRDSSSRGRARSSPPAP